MTGSKSRPSCRALSRIRLLRPGFYGWYSSRGPRVSERRRYGGRGVTGHGLRNRFGPGPNPFEEHRNGRPIRRAFPDVMQGHPPHWVHENVAAQLVDVIRGAPRPTPARDQPGVRPPGRGPPDRRPLAVTHPIAAIEHTPPVNQHRPPETHLANVLFGALPSLERHDYDHWPRYWPSRWTVPAVSSSTNSTAGDPAWAVVSPSLVDTTPRGRR